MISYVLLFGVTTSCGLLEQEVPVHVIPLSFKSNRPNVYFKISQHFWCLVIANDRNFRKYLGH